ncbi:MAG: SAP domain-containing protein [Promethearchaeota archaeon]
MKSIKDLLPDKKIPDLIHICKNLGLRGYTNLRKEGIINLINENVRNPQVQETIKFSIPDNGTVALILKSLIENKNEVKYRDLRNEVLENRSGSTFRDNYRTLLAQSFIFEDEKSEEDILYLPKEFSNIAKEIIEKRIQEEEPELEIEIANEEEEKEEKILTSIDQLLYSKKYTSVSGIQKELMERNLKISGTKDQLIDRLLYESNEPIQNILGLLFGKIELKEICREFDLLVSGTKETLIDRILEKLPPAHPDKVKSPVQEIESEEKIMIKEVTGVASGLAEEKISEIQPVKPIQEVEPQIRIVETIFNDLNNAWIDYKSITDNKSLAGMINTRLRNLPSLREAEIHRIDKAREEPLITIEKEGEVVVVFVWYFDKSKGYKTQMQKITFGIMTYSAQISKDVICYIYDPEPKLSEEDIGTFSSLSLVIRKTEREFK